MTVVGGQFYLEMGFFSGISLGQVAPGEEIPEKIVLLGKGATDIKDEGGYSSWRPGMPALKNGGVWTDSNTSNGRVLVSAPVSNVTETFRIVIQNISPQIRGSSVAALNRMAEAARAFHATESQPLPVHLVFRPIGVDQPQYALVYNIDIAADIDSFELQNATIVNLSIEREPYWKFLPNGANPKLYSFYRKGWRPNVDYLSSTLSLINAYANDEDFQKANIYPFDEINTLAINYVDIDLRDHYISGDAQAQALITFQAKTTGISGLYIARSTRRDLFSGSGTNRARNTFNGGDITINSGNPTVTKVVDATNGLLSNGSTVTRYVLQLVYAAGTISGTSVGSWSRLISQYPGRYAAFLRAQVTAGTVDATKFYLEYAFGGSNINLQQTIPRHLDQTGYGFTHLGTVDFTLIGNRYVTHLGTGIDTTTTFTMRLHTLKSSAETPTVRVWDVVLMPIDEPNAMITLDFASLSVDDFAFMDTTGYFGAAKVMETAMSLQSSTLYQRRLSGIPITLTPGIQNRLYFLPRIGTPTPATPHQMRLNIVPRWQSLRTP